MTTFDHIRGMFQWRTTSGPCEGKRRQLGAWLRNGVARIMVATASRHMRLCAKPSTSTVHVVMLEAPKSNNKHARATELLSHFMQLCWFSRPIFVRQNPAPPLVAPLTLLRVLPSTLPARHRKTPQRRGIYSRISIGSIMRIEVMLTSGCPLLLSLQPRYRIR